MKLPALEERIIRNAGHELVEIAMRLAVAGDRVGRSLADAERRAEAEALRADKATHDMAALIEDRDQLQLRVEAAEQAHHTSVHSDGQVIARLNDQLTVAHGDRDRAIAGERQALEDLAKVRSSFEAMRKTICDRLNLQDNATWPDILGRVG